MSSLAVTAAQFTLRIPRWQPFDDTIDVQGVDLTGFTLSLQARLYRDAPGDPLLDLSNAAPPAQGLSVTTSTTDGIVTSTIRIIINETTIETLLPYPGNGTEPNADVVLKYGLNLTGTGFPKSRWLEGDFIIIPGANQA